MARQSRKRTPPSAITDDLEANIACLEAVWNRQWSFHDMVISSIQRVAGRVIITLDELVLILTGVTRYSSDLEDSPCDEFGEIWMRHSLIGSGGSRTLRVETDSGHFEASFRNLRLIRPADYAVLIPPIDS